jgi:circadian clock protein KaiC
MTAHSQPPLKRLPTGVTGLDVLLDGGLFEGGIYFFMGRPGTGKTILGNQMAFNVVAAGHKVVYVTLLAESHARMLANLASMTFIAPEVIGDKMLYLGGYVVLREKKLPGLLELLRRMIRDERPKLLIVDGLPGHGFLDADETRLKEFIIELQMLGGMNDCTTVVLSNLRSEDANGAEHSMVDGMVELTVGRSFQRTLREIEVVKFRGSEHFMGRHDFEITVNGCEVTPRTEEWLAKLATPAAQPSGRVSTGVANLDAMANGGLISGTSTLLLGFAGSGKTMLSSHFLAAATPAEPALYFGFYESPERLLVSADSIGLPLRQRVEEGTVRLIWNPPLRHGLDKLAEILLTYVRRRGVRRLVIDGIDGFRQTAVYPERPIRFLTAVVNELRHLDVTTLLTEETQKLFGPEVEVRITGMSALVDNIILLEYLDLGSELKRLLSIVKQRGSDYATSVRELCITPHGMTLAETAESAQDILSGNSAQGISRRNRGPTKRSAAHSHGGPAKARPKKRPTRR